VGEEGEEEKGGKGGIAAKKKKEEVVRKRNDTLIVVMLCTYGTRTYQKKVFSRLFSVRSASYDYHIGIRWILPNALHHLLGTR
jgi:hypothetical protein